MHYNPDFLEIDRTDPDLIRIRTEDDGECVCSFAANAGWTDQQITHTLNIAYCSYLDGRKDGAEDGKSEIRRALGI